MNTDAIVQTIATGALALLGSLLAINSGRKKNRAETEGIVANQYNGLVQRLEEERKRDSAQRLELESKITQLTKEHTECEYQNEVVELELEMVKRMLPGPNTRHSVYVLDDSKLVLTEFEHKFQKISILNCYVFTEWEKFVLEANADEPEILVIDYMLGPVTAERVLENIEYRPKVIIMSADSSISTHIVGQGYQFFYKDSFYVQRIAKSIVKYLKDLNFSKQ